MPKHYVNEAGTDLIFDTGVLLGTVAFQYVKHKAPGSAAGSWVGVLYSSYSELAGAIGTYFVKYTLKYGDLNVAGLWKFQPWVGAVDGTWQGETVNENIYNELE